MVQLVFYQQCIIVDNIHASMSSYPRPETYTTIIHINTIEYKSSITTSKVLVFIWNASTGFQRE